MANHTSRNRGVDQNEDSSAALWLIVQLDREEAARLLAVERLRLTQDLVMRFDSLAAAAARRFCVPMAALSIVGRDCAVLKATYGMLPDAVPRSHALCDITVRRGAVFVVEDLAEDARISAHPALAELGIRFYAAAPVWVESGAAVGALCVMDTVRKRFSGEDRHDLETMANFVSNELIVRQFVFP